MTPQTQPAAFGRRGRRVVTEPGLGSEPRANFRLLPPPDESLGAMFFALDRRTSRKAFFTAFALTSFATLPGLSLVAPFAVPESGALIARHPVQFALGLVLFLVPVLLQMVQFVRRMHDQGYDTDEAVLLFSISMAGFIGPSMSGYPLASALTVIVYFAFAFKSGAPDANRWGGPCEGLTQGP